MCRERDVGYIEGIPTCRERDVGHIEGIPTCRACDVGYIEGFPTCRERDVTQQPRCGTSACLVDTFRLGALFRACSRF